MYSLRFELFVILHGEGNYLYLLLLELTKKKTKRYYWFECQTMNNILLWSFFRQLHFYNERNFLECLVSYLDKNFNAKDIARLEKFTH